MHKPPIITETLRGLVVGSLLVCSLAVSQTGVAYGQTEPGTAMQPHQQPAFDLGAFRWENRLLLVFAPTPQDTAYQDLKRQVQRRQQDFDERDMLLIEVLAQGSSRVGDEVLSPAAADGLRRQFGIAPAQFGVILIGKDGGVKLRANQPTPLAEVFGLIDTMPMRRREMQQQQ